MTKIKDYSHLNIKPDLVVCTCCGTKMFVDYDVDYCPYCGAKGRLTDIQQEVDKDDFDYEEVKE